MSVFLYRISTNVACVSALPEVLPTVDSSVSYVILSLLRTQNYRLWLVGWLVGMLLVSRSGLVKENADEVLHHYGFHLYFSYLI